MAACGFEGGDLVVAVPDVACTGIEVGADITAADMVGCSYIKAGSTDESGKAKCATEKYGLADEASSASDVMMG